jgi:transcription-repair coupling factor (superfamily II helicase)
MERIKQQIFESEPFQLLLERIQNIRMKERVDLHRVAGSLRAFVASAVFEHAGRQMLLIASDDDAAQRLRDDCALLMGEPNVRYFAVRPLHPGQTLDVTSSVAQIEAMRSLAVGERVVVVASSQSIVERVPPPEQFAATIVELRSGTDYNFQELLNRMEGMGFERKDFVGGYGEFAVRGGIVDVFPFVGENPIRFEFWGDAIESIREFDVLSQRSIRDLQSASIVPSLDRGDPATDERGSSDSSLFDYLQRDAFIVLDDPTIIEREINELFAEDVPDAFTFEYVNERASSFPCLVHRTLESHSSQIHHPLPGIDFGSSSQPAFNGSVNTLVAHLQKLTNDDYTIYLTSDTDSELIRLRELIEDVQTRPDELPGARPAHVPIEPLDESHVHAQQFPTESQQANPQTPDRNPLLTRIVNPSPIFLSETLHSGFIFHPAALAVFTEHEIFGRLRRRAITKRRRFKGFSQKELQQLKPGDYVVHVDHGIGSFAGLTKLTVGGAEQEVMKLLFLENDVLYVNLNYVNRVQKYSSQEGHTPKLNKLGAGDWDRMKQRAKRRIKDIARDIIALYARRKLEKGDAFSPDTHWQRELEASFMYEDTPDQITATTDVKRDMENPSPMDRLICGDVGFGKTEVAVRAAFKAVMDGKQAAILVPTTILAMQHYHTFADRLARYGTRVEHLTRFKSTQEQKRIVEDLHRGAVDIVIGTHRLLSKDIGFKDLGLLVIDEEHRFGVSAKEKLRQLRASVDTLSMTATPIPRTLHFSLIGARDLSLITTPPRNRLPIVTEIIPFDARGQDAHWRVVREAILRELHRGGQTYFVHDRVQDIDAVAEHVRRRIPEARIHIAHGQMKGHELEQAMIDFLERKYDVLIATKIIESGLDIPNVNTMIVNRADRFGLAELYQLRGRVGRSNVQAYAYLLVPPLSALPRQTLRRLQAIEEFTELGSGFNLAMRDLEIRGAGNLLGAEQSGFILDMGFEMYERIVREAVDELRQEEFTEVLEPKHSSAEVIETVVESDVEALIPDFYIEADAERLDIYRRLYGATTEEDLRSMRDELSDRFGEYPDEVENLFRLIELRLLASRAGLPKIALRGEMFVVTLPDESRTEFYGTSGNQSAPFHRLMEQLGRNRRRDVQLKQEGKELTLRFTRLPVDGTTSRIEEAKRRLIDVVLQHISGVVEENTRYSIESPSNPTQ